MLRAFSQKFFNNRRSGAIVTRCLDTGLFDWFWLAPRVGAFSKLEFVRQYADQWKTGLFEPNEFFNSQWYVKNYPNALSEERNPLLHFHNIGWRKGFNPSPSFDTTRYLFEYRDVMAALLNPLAHYIAHGRREGRKIFAVPNSTIQAVKETQLFDPNWYARQYGDIVANNLDPLEHFACFGWKEGRSPCEFFDLPWFSKLYSKELGDENPVIFYSRKGHDPIYIPSRRFDPSFYLDNHPDVRRSRANPLVHYMAFGRKEGRSIAAFTGTRSKGGNDEPESLVDSPQLQAFARYGAVRSCSDHQIAPDAGLALHVVIPDFSAGAGGHMTIFRLLNLLELRGFRVVVWIFNPKQHHDAELAYDDIVRHFKPLAAQIRLFDDDAFFNATGDILMATSWDTVYPVMANGNFLSRFYLVQDFEPDFYGAGSMRVAAENTYTFDINCVCASPWLAQKMETQYGRWARFFYLSADRDTYFPPAQKRNNRVPRIAFYARKFTERRCVELGFLALEVLARKGVTFHVDFFGETAELHTDQYSFTNHGVLSATELADLYRGADLGLVFSLTNYSLVPKEMMACRLPVVEFDTQSTRAIFPPGVVRFVGPSPEAIASSLQELLLDEDARNSMADAAWKWSSKFSWDGAADIVENAIRDRLTERTGLPLPAVIGARPLKAAVVIPTLNGGDVFEKVVDAINSQECPWDFETVVIDSGSADATVQTASRLKNLNLIQIKKNEFGHGRTRNLGFVQSSAPFVAFLTQDAIPMGRHWLFNLVSSLERRESAAGVFGRHVAHEDASAFTKSEINAHFASFESFPLYLSRHTDLDHIGRSQQHIEQVLHFYSDNNSCMRRSVWEAHPYPDVSFGEDQLWARRIINAGLEKAYSPHAVVFHSHNYTYEEVFDRSAIESEFFFQEFGHRLISDSANIQEIVRSMNASSQDFARLHNVPSNVLALQMKLNEARILGYKKGLENARLASV